MQLLAKTVDLALRCLLCIGGIVCHVKQRASSYGYSVSMVTRVCSYGDRNVLLMLFVFLVKLLSGMRIKPDLAACSVKRRV